MVEVTQDDVDALNVFYSLSDSRESANLPPRERAYLVLQMLAAHRLAAEAESDVFFEALQCIANRDWSFATVESMRALAIVAIARREHAGEG